MKKGLSILFILFLGISVRAETSKEPLFKADSTGRVAFVQHTIMLGKHILGKYKVDEKETDGDYRGKSKVYNVKIFSPDQQMVAEYEVEVLDKVRKSDTPIIAASLKTLADHVTHNAANFIDYHHVFKKNVADEAYAPQLAKAVEYLIAYDYL